MPTWKKNERKKSSNYGVKLTNTYIIIKTRNRWQRVPKKEKNGISTS